MAKTEASKDESAAAATGGAAAKKKSTPKPRKRKASDVGTGSKAGASPAKKNATDENRADRWSDKNNASGAASGDTHPVVIPAIKPFIKGELVETIKHMMFGFGDEAEPLDETAELMEDLVVEYAQSMTKKAMELSLVKGKLDTECFIFLIRKDPERYERIKELLRANDEFRAVLNSGFDPSDEKMY